MKIEYNRLESLPAKFIRWFNMIRIYINYLHSPNKLLQSNVIFFIIDPTQKQAGFADRLKAIINTYEIAKRSDLDFKIFYEHPFPLQRYLLPAKCDWICQHEDMDFSILSSRLAVYNAVYHTPKWRKGYQYHVRWYRGQDMIRRTLEISGGIDSETKWKILFKHNFDELFKPSLYLNNLIASTGLNEKGYISVHFRFVNSLGLFENNTRSYSILSDNEQKKLIDRCLNELTNIKKENPYYPIIVFSDSEKFVNICVNKGYKRINGGKIEHIACTQSQNANDKIMLDFFTIARSKKVYSIVFPGMYAGAYSEYAALIGGAEFIRIIKSI